LCQQELARIIVQLANTLTRVLEVALTVKLLVRYVQGLINAHHVKIVFFFLMELAEQIVLLIWLQAQISVNA
jgi:hypothetical protein